MANKFQNFICYPFKHIDRARNLRNHIQKTQPNWVDWIEVIDDDDWEEMAKTKLKYCSTIYIVWCECASKSKSIKKELNWAREYESALKHAKRYIYVPLGRYPCPASNEILNINI